MATKKNRIREWREERGLTLEALAAKINTDKSMLARLERGERTLSLKWLHALAAALGVNQADLIEDEVISKTRLELARGSRPTVLETTDKDAWFFAHMSPHGVDEEIVLLLPTLLTLVRQKNYQDAISVVDVLKSILMRKERDTLVSRHSFIAEFSKIEWETLPVDLLGPLVDTILDGYEDGNVDMTVWGQPPIETLREDPSLHPAFIKWWREKHANHKPEDIDRALRILGRGISPPSVDK